MRQLLLIISLLFVPVVNATYVYEANQSLIDLKTNYIATSYNLGVGDDQVSSTFNLDFTFTFYGEDFTMAKMATNGCLHFWASGSSGYCNDYTPDPLPEQKYTLYPFWTDLIRDNGSKVLARNFTDKTVFGWYNLREYNRANTDNSFEVILWKADDSFEFRYGALDIINHDVLIGEQGDTDEIYTYLYYDMCGKGTTNGSNCFTPTWNASTYNTLLENGGSLYGVGSGNALDCSNPLNNSACTGYAAAYLTQQCGLDSLYSESCPLYWDAYDDLQCTLDPQYGPFCAGYTQEQSVAYYTEEEYFDYGYDDEDQYGYEDDSYGYDEDPYANMEFTDEEWYAIDLEEFGQEQVDEWYGTEVAFSEEGYIEFDSYMEEETYFTILEEGMEEFDLSFEDVQDYVEEFDYIEEYQEFDYTEEISFEDLELLPEHDLVALNIETIEEFRALEIIEEALEFTEEEEFLEFETLEELEEWFEEEMMEEEAFEEVFEELEEEFEEEFEEFEEEVFAEEDYEEEMFEEEAVEEIFEELEELEEERLAEEEIEEALDEETVVAREESKSGIRQDQLNVVASTIQTATNSVSGTTSGSSIYSTGNTVASGGVGSSISSASTMSAASSSGGMSMSSSPSISAQVQSSAIQNNTILDMSASANTGGSTFESTTTDSNTSTTSADSGESTSTESTTETTVASSSTTTSSSMDTAVQTLSTSTMTASTQTQTSSMEAEISTAVGGDMSASEADLVADQIIADNIAEQQEQLQEQQEESGEYADATTLIAYMGFVPGFDSYKQVTLPEAAVWYESRDIYANVTINDNTTAFFGLYSESLTGLQNLRKLQPNL